MRRSARVRLQSAGRIVLMDYSEARSILVQDLSVEGARLTVGDWQDLPERFHLLLRRDPSEPHFQVDCTVRWRAGAAVGVEFDRPIAGFILNELIRQPSYTH
jgi:PilZ domain